MPDTFDLGRDVLAVSGPDSTLYLQGQLSQDVAALAVGGSAWSWLLAPNGKVDALVRVSRTADASWLVDTDAGYGPPVQARLERFRLRTKVDFELTDHRVWRRLAPAGTSGPARVLAAVAPWPGLDAFDWIGDEVPSGAGGPAEYEPYRIAAGIPRMGAELDERTIPAEAGIVDWTVSFEKGCYTGQELVARIDSRGNNVPRHLVGLRGAGPPIAAGAAIETTDGAPAGTVTSVAAGPHGSGWVGLGYVRRAVGVDVPLVAEGAAVTQVQLNR